MFQKNILSEAMACFTKYKISRASHLYLEFKSSNSQSKPLNIQTVEYDIHIKISLKIKFYIFLKFFAIF
jgi:hypothetical protein